jgi:hypothetical protein
MGTLYGYSMANFERLDGTSSVRRRSQDQDARRFPDTTSVLDLRLRCREIASVDVGRIADLLTRGFPERTREFWLRALKRLSEHSAPAGFPK